MRYDWDEDKAAANFRKHGVSFEEAVHALGDPFAVERIDERFDYDEERRIAILQGVSSLLHVVYTERGDVTRIISAREATRNEQNNYYRQNAP